LKIQAFSALTAYAPLQVFLYSASWDRIIKPKAIKSQGNVFYRFLKIILAIQKNDAMIGPKVRIHMSRSPNATIQQAGPSGANEDHNGLAGLFSDQHTLREKSDPGRK